ncbi:type II secretion system protein GspK [Candidatus Halobeggiatoa sp. HSG11]|nr:type II secretion system protein GspK [Candidatus Halobeggiatoa sp. HSG11]
MQKQRGVIIIIVLWFIVVVTVIVAALATETRLAAKAVFHNKKGLQTWNDTLQALNSAKMELLINRMPDPPGEEQDDVPLEERKNKRYRFNGQILTLAYPVPKTVTVRIYDQSGKINLQSLSKMHLRQLLEKRIGDDPEKLQPLLDAWNDWIDRDDFERVNGAEKKYYETLSPPYEPRNFRLETVEELLLIKGFDEAFKGVEIDAVFTVYGNNSRSINPNLATREALMLLPGMTGAAADTILVKRRKKDFKSYNDFNEFMEPEQLAKVRSWINFSSSNFFTIAIQVQEVEDEDSEETDDERSEESEKSDKQITPPPANEKNQRAYMVTVQTKGFNQLPKVLLVSPYGILPSTAHEQIVDEDDDSFSPL